MASPGRPTKLTPKTCKAIVGYVADGNFFETACAAAGIDKATGHRWLVRGKAERDRIQKGADPILEEAPYREFRDAIEKARATPITELTNLLMIEARDGDRKAMEYLLGRLSPPQPQQSVDVPDSIAGLVDILQRARAERHG